MKSIVVLKEDFVTDVKVGNYSAVLDKPSSMGGTKGMCPGEAMLTAIAGCKIMSFKMAVQAKGMNFEDYKDLQVEVSSELNDIGNLEGTQMAKLRIKSIHTVYKLKTTKSKSEIEELLKSVDELCVVGQALDDSIIKTQEIVIN